MWVGCARLDEEVVAVVEHHDESEIRHRRVRSGTRAEDDRRVPRAAARNER